MSQQSGTSYNGKVLVAGGGGGSAGDGYKAGWNGGDGGGLTGCGGHPVSDRSTTDGGYAEMDGTQSSGGDSSYGSYMGSLFTGGVRSNVSGAGSGYWGAHRHGPAPELQELEVDLVTWVVVELSVRA